MKDDNDVYEPVEARGPSQDASVWVGCYVRQKEGRGEVDTLSEGVLVDSFRPTLVVGVVMV